MKKFFLSLFLISSFLYGADNITIQNRILAKINNQPLSVVDVAKKMDFIFFREYPQYANSDEARLEFYTTNWRTFLDDMIDEQLILANAKELKVTVSEGEVRQEIEASLGPNVIAKIDQMGLTFSEIFKMVQNDLVVRRMVFAMVQSKAAACITPALVKNAYEQFSTENPVEEAWNYQVVTIRSNTELSAVAASQIFLKKIEQDKLDPAKAKESIDLPDVQVTVSEEFHRTAKTLSETHKTILSSLKNKEHSASVPQTSAKKGEYMTRIFFLNEYKESGKIPFSAVEDKIKNQLIQKASVDESLHWRNKLRERYGIDKNYLSAMIPEGLKPFSLSRPK